MQGRKVSAEPIAVSWDVPVRLGPGEESSVRRCIRHAGAELIEDERDEEDRKWDQGAGMRCPVDKARVRTWEVWDQINQRRMYVADVDNGAHPENAEEAELWARWERDYRVELAAARQRRRIQAREGR